MNRNAICVAIAVIGFVGAHRGSSEPKNAATHQVFGPHGDGYSDVVLANFTRQELQGFADWDDSKPNPPIASRTAMKLAYDMVTEQCRNDIEIKMNCSLSEIVLKHVYEKDWVWIARYDLVPTEIASVGRPWIVEIVVTMDGNAHPGILDRPRAVEKKK